MEKIEFLQKAPIYYALAIAASLESSKGAFWTIDQLDDALSTRHKIFHHQGLVWQGAKILEDAGVIEVVPDDFGPTLYRYLDGFVPWFREDAGTLYPVFRKYHGGGGNYWLIPALQQVNEAASNLDVTASDFASAVEAEWEPIPIDREDERLKIAADAVDQAIKEIEADNGYAVHAPAEREYVLTNLKSFRVALQERAEVYWTFVKTFGIDPLSQVVKRFGPAAVGVAAQAARAAVFDWLKANCAKLLSLISG
jgi:hypothetical protein